MAQRVDLGVIGGIGPVASARFVLSVYEHQQQKREQDMLSVVLLSTPAVPDRTEALTTYGQPVLTEFAIQQLLLLHDLRAAQSVVCCFTLHHVLRDVPAHLKTGLVSLPELALSLAAEEPGPSLLLCSNGSRQLRLFEREPEWSRVEDKIILPSEKDQESVHRVLYALKRNGAPARGYAALTRIAARYEAHTLLCGCSEMHLVSCYAKDRETDQIRFIDPLMHIAKSFGPAPSKS